MIVIISVVFIVCFAFPDQIMPWSARECRACAHRAQYERIQGMLMS